MPDYSLSRASLRSLKNTLLDCFPDVKSAHLSEAIAAAAGYRSNAALLVDFAGPSATTDVLLDSGRFVARLHRFGYSVVEPFSFSKLSSAHRTPNKSPNSTILTTEEATMPKLFFSYSHVDEALRDRLEVHLALMKNQRLIETWHDRRIVAGSNIDAAIDENLESADVILLLVSADFLASWYCYSVEMERALKRHEEGSAYVIPVILEPCDWHSAPFGKLLAVPRDGKAVTTWANQAEAWADVAKQIRRAVETLAAESSSKATPALGQVSRPLSVVEQPVPSSWNPMAPFNPASGQPTAERPRSSNLRLKKEFSDFDRDKFVHDTFDYMGKFFEASLQELAERNRGIQGRFQRRSDEAFSAVIYREGKAISECSVRLGGLGGRSPGLAFSYSATASSSTFNEMLSIESDSQSMYFKPLGMQF